MLTLLLAFAFWQTDSGKAAPPAANDTFTSRATCRIDSKRGVYIWYEDGQHGLYKWVTAADLRLDYAPICGFPLPGNAGRARP
jgi:hypothetical protein